MFKSFFFPLGKDSLENMASENTFQWSLDGPANKRVIHVFSFPLWFIAGY